MKPKNEILKLHMNITSRLLITALCTSALLLPTPLLAAKGGKKGKKADQTQNAGKAARPGMLLKKYDADSNGSIDGTEVEALRKAFDADKTGPLKKLDANSNGTLDDTEISAIKKGKGKQKKAGAGGKKKARKNK